MKYLALTLFIAAIFVSVSKAQTTSFPTGLGIEIEGDYSLLVSETIVHPASNVQNDLISHHAGNYKDTNNPDFLNPTFRYTQSSLFTHSHRRNADAFTNWRPVDNRYENRTQIFIDGARGLFQVIRGQ